MELVNFGKHNGKPVEFLLQDEEYCRWLNAQNWFLAKYAELHKQIQERHFLSEETPVHNAMQLKWLDPNILIQLFPVISSRRDKLNKLGLAFPSHFFKNSQADAISEIIPEGSGYWDVQFKMSGFDCHVELKPQLGDDYPSVLRKMMSQKSYGAHRYYFLVASSLASEAADKEALIKFFALQKIIFVLEEELQIL
jgi:hypothetical protein